MNSKDTPKYRKLSITSLLTGIIAFCFASLNLLIYLLLDFFNIFSIIWNIFFIISYLEPVAFGLSITAIVCGSIDLWVIKKSYNSNKSKVFDIEGIVLGGTTIFFYFFINFLIKK
jgi:hypothetical protein